jgi:RimJ/RimL family protein N-acetyltransferase
MLRYVFDQHELVAHFVAQMIPHVRRAGFGPACRAIGITNEDNELIAGLVYHSLSPEFGLIEISGAALPGFHWLTRETLRLMFQYPFVQCGCQMVIMKVQIENERLLSQLVRLGFELIRLPRIYGRDHDGVFCYLTYEAWMQNAICQRYKHHVIQTKRAEEAA